MAILRFREYPFSYELNIYIYIFFFFHRSYLGHRAQNVAGFFTCTIFKYLPASNINYRQYTVLDKLPFRFIIKFIVLHSTYYVLDVVYTDWIVVDNNIIGVVRIVKLNF